MPNPGSIEAGTLVQGLGKACTLRFVDSRLQFVQTTSGSVCISERHTCADVSSIETSCSA